MSASTTLPDNNLLKLTLPCRGNRAPATISRLSVEVLRLCKEIDCFYEGDKRELSQVSLSSFRQLHGGKQEKHSALSSQHSAKLGLLADIECQLAGLQVSKGLNAEC